MMTSEAGERDGGLLEVVAAGARLEGKVVVAAALHALARDARDGTATRLVGLVIARRPVRGGSLQARQARRRGHRVGWCGQTDARVLKVVVAPRFHSHSGVSLSTVDNPQPKATKS